VSNLPKGGRRSIWAPPRPFFARRARYDCAPPLRTRRPWLTERVESRHPHLISSIGLCPPPRARPGLRPTHSPDHPRVYQNHVLDAPVTSGADLRQRSSSICCKPPPVTIFVSRSDCGRCPPGWKGVRRCAALSALRLVTYGFLHGSVTHLFFNMLGTVHVRCGDRASVGEPPVHSLLFSRVSCRPRWRN